MGTPPGLGTTGPHIRLLQLRPRDSVYHTNCMQAAAEAPAVTAPALKKTELDFTFENIIENQLFLFA